MFPKAEGDALKCLVCPQPRDIQFTVIEEWRNQKIFTFVEAEIRIFFKWLKTQKLIIRIVGLID